MEQLLLHLVGDYLTQSNWMALNKTKSWWPAFVHALVYTLPFFWLTQSPLALFVILGSHFLIDRYRLARYVVFFKNWLNEPFTMKWKDCTKTGYPDSTPDYLAFWLLIIGDNTTHLIVNYAALRWL